MTQVKAFHTGDVYRIEAFGHATGSAEVCAAVSTMLTALAGYLRNEPDIEIIKSELQDAQALLEFRGGEKACAVYELTLIGLLQLSLAKPEYVTVCQV